MINLIQYGISWSPVLFIVINSRLPEVTNNHIEQLKGASGTPLEYLISPRTPMVTTQLGEVQLGSFLSYQV